MATLHNRTHHFLSELAQVAIRVPILFFVDFIVNGGFFISMTYSLGFANNELVDLKPNLYDVLFAMERQNISAAWNELSWTDYTFFYCEYLSMLNIAAILFFMEASTLLNIFGHFAPTVLAIASITFSLESGSHSGRNTIDSDPSSKSIPASEQLLLLTFRTLYGFAAGQLFCYLRWPLYELILVGAIDRIRLFTDRIQSRIDRPRNPVPNYATTFFKYIVVQIPFFSPLLFWMTRSTSSSLVLAMFAPIFLFECGLCFVAFWRFTLPYIIITAITVSRLIAEPDLLRLQLYVKMLWVRLRIPQVFQTFFFARISLHLVYVVYVLLVLGPQNDPYGVFAKRHLHTDWLWTSGENVSKESEIKLDPIPMAITAIEYLLARFTETVPAILATTSVLTIIGDWTGSLFNWLLNGGRHRIRVNRRPGGVALVNDQNNLADAPIDQDRFIEEIDNLDERNDSFGHVTGVLFLILCLQTGLTSLSAEKRLWKLYRNLWLLSMAILHFVHHMVHSTMNRLCTHGRFRWTKHARAIILGLFLFFAPFLFFKLTWRHKNWFNPWLISVAIFAVELSSKMLITFITYALMLVDLWRPRANIEELLYFVKSMGAILDFFFGFCLLVNGIWILLFEHGGVLRTCMICIHGYFNIYQRAVTGLAELRRRRLATRKLNSLQTATEQRLLDARYEVCAICYVEFQEDQDNSPDRSPGIVGWVPNEVKVTACGHMLHAACLLKWLYIRDTCPLCHQIVFKDESLRSGGHENDIG